MTRSAALLVVALAACGGGKHVEAPVDISERHHEHWEDVSTQQLYYPEPCGMGPFEITVPKRDDDPRFAYGRRFIFQVYAQSALDLDSRLKIGETESNFQWAAEEDPLAHGECRPDVGVPVAQAVGGPAIPVPGRPGKKREEGPPEPKQKLFVTAIDTPASDLPKLVEFHGEITVPPRQFAAVMVLPKGDPFYYADTEGSSRWIQDAGGAYSLRFWTRKPSKLEHVIFRLVEQRLVPDPMADYAAVFAQRVAAVKVRRDADAPAALTKIAAHDAFCKDHPTTKDCENKTYGRMPPPPRHEVKPRAPADNVEWVGGYWAWDDALDDFAWIAGTFVIRPQEVTAAAPVAIAAPVVEAPRELDVKIEDAPPARAEVVLAPPSVVQPNTAWIAGHWELAGRTWRWTPGTWTAAPTGMRYRAPTVHVRGAVRVYLPGGFVRFR